MCTLWLISRIQLAEMILQIITPCVVLLLLTIVAVESETSVKPGINELAWYMSAKLYKPPENLFASSFSLSTALSMLYVASCGSTANELTTLLNFQSFSAPEDVKSSFQDLLTTVKPNGAPYTFDVANAVYLNQSFNILSSYQDLLQEYFYANIDRVDFTNDGKAAKTKINNFVNEATQGMIPTIMDSDPDPGTVMFLVDAIYFKGLWQSPFNENNTKKEDFGLKKCNCNGAVLPKAQIMQQKSSFRYYNSSELQAELIELPYNSTNTDSNSTKNVSMIVILPHEQCDFSNWFQSSCLTFGNIDAATATLVQQPKILVDLKIPKFKIEETYNIGALMASDLSVSMSDAACFNVTGKPDVKISSIVQKAIIEVSEEGTKAAAVTGIGVVTTSIDAPPPQVLQFNATRPFLFYIMLDSVILFHGAYLTP